MVNIDRSVQQIAINIVNAHGTMVGTADTAEKGTIAGSDGIVDVEILLRSVANVLNKFGVVFLPV